MQLNIKTSSAQEFVNITKDIEKNLKNNGLVHILIPHTTAGITINEGADSDVKKDIINKLNKLIPENNNYLHLEGNSHAHIKTSLVGSSIVLSFQNGKLELGKWQSVFFCEFDGPRQRKILLKIINI
ncbi:MAG: secondary thiamine-phosphate synthase enzyme YjbQ [Minisyncoccales bacterium]